MHQNKQTNNHAFDERIYCCRTKFQYAQIVFIQMIQKEKLIEVKKYSICPIIIYFISKKGRVSFYIYIYNGISHK